jgi:hypothetical protein
MSNAEAAVKAVQFELIDAEWFLKIDSNQQLERSAS